MVTIGRLLATLPTLERVDHSVKVIFRQGLFTLFCRVAVEADSARKNGEYIGVFAASLALYCFVHFRFPCTVPKIEQGVYPV